MIDKRKQVLNLTKEEKRLISIALEHLIDECREANELIPRSEDKVDLSPIQSLLQKFKKHDHAEETILAEDSQPRLPWRKKP